MGDKRATPTAVKQLSRWIRSRSVRQLVTMASIAAFIFLILLKLFVRNYTYFYIAAQLAHSIGILVLIYKLTITKTCSGLSVKTQELTAIFLTIRLVSHFTFTRDIYIALDCITLVSTLWVIYMIRFKLKNTYLKELDNMPLYYVLVPCFIIAVIGNPGSGIIGVLYMFSKTIEAISVLPQLRLIQNAKVVEPFTAHYVFALGVARFFSCANWIYMIIDTKGAILTGIGRGQLYLIVILLAEVVQTFILTDFCYYYIKSVMEGQSMMRLPSMV
ncbi:putative ER lumen protein-retaining receptor C28H8.4 [Chenopodium quinoa]|uniref:ER lumen protein retaining receptor n=1 Tax=Chenopodium quinoa TaxID=63459 RepID=A0A803LNK6_CHEQI|nr:putative ER lumen protein-retaining receptor C28H8.4 [Chenopodium quinoa]